MDDSGDLRRALAWALTHGGCEVVGEAANGQEAIDLLQVVKCNRVVMDRHMPALDGGQATRAVSQSHPDVEIIGYSVGEGVDVLLGAGARRVFSKRDMPAPVAHVARPLGASDQLG